MIKIDQDNQTKREFTSSGKTRKPKAYCKEFTLVDVPIRTIKRFVSDVKERYGNIYWVKLNALMIKAEAYDALMAELQYAKEQDDEEAEIKPEGQEVMTFTGKVSNNKKTKEGDK